jgi:hypothetical protein
MALEEARRYGIETMDLSEAREADWNAIVNKLKEVFVGRFNFRISRGSAVLAEEYGTEEESPIGPAEPLYSPDGQPLGPVGEIARERLRQPDSAKKLLDLFYANQDRSRATATLDVPAGCYLIDTSGARWRVRAIKLEIECELIMTPVSLQHGTIGAAQVAWGQATDGPDQLFLVSTERQGHSRRMTLRLVQAGDQSEQLVNMTDASSPS